MDSVAKKYMYVNSNNQGLSLQVFKSLVKINLAPRIGLRKDLKSPMSRRVRFYIRNCFRSQIRDLLCSIDEKTRGQKSHATVPLKLGVKNRRNL